MKKFIEKTGGGLLLKVKVNPNSEGFKIKEVNKWTGRLEIDLSASAKKGKANQELLEKLGEILEKEVSIKTGRTSRKKLILVNNVTEEEVMEKLDIGE